MADTNSPSGSPQAAAAALEQAREALRERDGERALSELDLALAADPDMTQALELRAMLRCQQGRLDDGLQDFLAVTRIEPDRASAWLNLGKCRRDAGQHGAAVEALDRALALEPGLPDARVLLALSRRDMGDDSAALEELRAAVEAAPNHLPSVSGLAMQLQKTGAETEALAYFVQARDLDPGIPQTHYNLGRAQLSAGQIAEAEQSLQHALTLNHHYHPARLALGELAEERQQPDVALNLYRRLVRREPGFLPGQVAMMGLLARQRRLSEMQTHLSQLPEALASSVLAQFWQAQLQARRGQLQEARATFEGLLRLAELPIDPALVQAEIEALDAPAGTDNPGNTP